MVRVRLALVTLAALAVGTLEGCPPPLDEPGRFTAACSGAETVEGLFAARCDGPSCHGAGAVDPSTGLKNLQLVGVDAKVLAYKASDGCGEGQSGDLVRPGEPDHSYLFLKVGGVPGAGICGGTMPLNRPALCKADLGLLGEWIAGQAADAGVLADSGHDVSADVASDAASDADSADSSSDADSPDSPSDSTNEGIDP